MSFAREGGRYVGRVRERESIRDGKSIRKLISPGARNSQLRMTTDEPLSNGHSIAEKMEKIEKFMG